MEWKVPLFKIYWDEADTRSVVDTIRRGMYWSTGPEQAQLEKMLADYVGRKFAVVFNSGTSALHAALLASGIGKQDEVIVPSFTFVATSNAPLFVGASVKFADIEEETLGLDPDDVLKRITRRTKAMIPVHYAGCPCRIRELKEIAGDHHIVLIEDAAESLGAKIDGNNVGTFGDLAIFSFASNKLVTTGDGGFTTTDSRDLYEKLKLIRSHGRLETEDYFTSAKAFDYVALGYNWRMPSMVAALGISQMSKIGKIIGMRRDNAAYLTQKLSKLEGIETPMPSESHYCVFQLYTIKLETGRQTRDALKDYLARKGIMTKVYFDPVHLTFFYKEKFGFKGGELPVTERVSSQVLSLPMYPTLSRVEMNYVISSISEFMHRIGV